MLQNWKWLVFFTIVVITDEVFSTLISVFLKQHGIKIFNFFQLNYVARHKHGLDLSKFLLLIIFWTILLLVPKLSFSIIFWIISLNFLNKSTQLLILGVWKKVFCFFSAGAIPLKLRYWIGQIFLWNIKFFRLLIFFGIINSEVLSRSIQFWMEKKIKSQFYTQA